MDSITPRESARIRQEMQDIQNELQGALHDLIAELGKKLTQKELAQIKAEFDELSELIERLKTGLAWLGVFGKTSVGKSAIINSLMEADVAEVGVRMDLTDRVTPYRRDPWMFSDMPGVMGKAKFEKIALDEAKRSHGILFILDGEPLEDEMEMFEAVNAALPSTPKLVFVNKWDLKQLSPRAEREEVMQLVRAKMRQFVGSDDDIVFGSAQIYDPVTDQYQRQSLPKLIDRMYEGAGTLGMVMNVLDPASRAEKLGTKIRDKIMEARIKIARKVVSTFGVSEIGVSWIPFATFFLTPGLLGSLVFLLMKILGVKTGGDRERAKSIAIELGKACRQVMVTEFAATTAAEAAASAGAMLLGPLVFVGMAGVPLVLGYYKYRRTVIFGEVVIEYLRHDCSWGGEDRHVVIQRCKDAAHEHYMKFKWKHAI